MAISLRRPKRRPQAELLSHYDSELRRSQHWRSSEGYDQLWVDMVEAYKGRSIIPKLPELSSQDRILVNQAFSTINVIYPAVSVAFPKINVMATKQELGDRAVFVDAMLNYQWRHYGLHDPFREAVKDSLIIGHGWCKTMWTYEEIDAEFTDEEFAEAFAVAERDERQTAEAEGRNPADDTEIARRLLDSQTTAIEDRPVVERISPWDMFVNPEATSLRDATWIAQRVVRHVDDVRNDPAYARKARESVQGGLTNLNGGTSRHEGEHVSQDMVAVWEFYDLRRGTMCVFAGSQPDGYLVRPRKMPYSFGHPFSLLTNYDVPDHFYPIGDLEMIVPLVKELSKTRSEMMNHRAKYARKYLVRSAALKGNQAHKLASKKDGDIIEVADDSVPLGDVVAPVPQVPMDAGLYNWTDVIEGDIVDVSGVSEFARGGQSQIRRTATEAALLQDAQNARSAEKLDKVEGFLGELAKRLLQINQQFVTGEQVARIVGREGASIFVPYTREDIKGSFDFEIEAGSTQPRNESYRRQSALTMMQAVAPFIELGAVNVTELLRHVLRDGFDVKNPEKFLTSQGAAPTDVQSQLGGVGGANAPQPTPIERADADVAASLQPAPLGG